MDTTRVAETREWGRDPREASEERPASPSQTSGVKRPREANSSSDKNRGEPEEENPWKVWWYGRVDVAVGVCKFVLLRIGARLVYCRQ